jgi:SAM-dependent methyltransferase
MSVPSSKSQIFHAYLLLAVIFGLAAAIAQSGSTASQRKTSTPYTGDLSIFESPGREQRLHIDRVMDALAIAPGKSVADIGAGSGWFTVRAAKRVTSSGEVYAVDINPDAIAYINRRVAGDGVHNVKTILSTPKDPELPANSIDAVLLLKTYHEVSNPVVLMRNLRSALRPSARIGIIDRSGNGENHGVQKSVVVREMGEAGYRLVDEQNNLVKDDDMDYFLIFTEAPH